MDTGDLIEPGSGCRSASELATLMLELGRMVKARRFYEPGDAHLAPIFERGLRTWRSDLERRAALDLEVRKDGFRERGGRGTVAHAKLADLLRDLRSRGVSRICFAGDLDVEAIAGFVEAVALGVADLQSRGGFQAVVYAHAPLGIVVNDCPPGSLPEANEELAFVDEEPDSAAGGPGPGGEATPERTPSPPDEAPPESDAPAEHAGLEQNDGFQERDLFGEPGGSLEAMAAEDAEARHDPSLPEGQFEPTPSLDLAPAVEAAPLERGVADQRSAEIVDVLRELDSCEDTAQYVELARQASRLAERASEMGRWDDCYRIMLVLSDHATGKREDRQQELARSFLSSIAQERRLENLIDRACAAGDAGSVRASQVLLGLGEEVVGPLLAAAETERNPDRRAQMHGVLIAMGEKILGELLRRMDGDDLEALKTAVRLTGETQNPDGVPRLSQLLAHSDASVREEAAKALVRVGSERAIDALIRALRSQTPGMPELAVYCLGATAQTRAIAPLVQALHDAIEEHRVERGREIIRALGRIARPEATAALADLLRRKSLIERRWMRDLKVAAAAVLGGLPGDDAVGALAQAARSKDSQLRRAAQTSLDRRAQALGRSDR